MELISVPVEKGGVIMADVRLIDVNAAIERAKESDKIVGSSIWETCEVVEFLENCPIKDAAPVVHGRWIEDDETARRYCSHCGFSIRDDASYELYGDYQVKPKHCPECGARMDL
jgi:hypothetical protein